MLNEGTGLSAAVGMTTFGLYTEEGLTMRRKRPKRRFVSSTVRQGRPVVQSVNECWGMDFVVDQLVMVGGYMS